MRYDRNGFSGILPKAPGKAVGGGDLQPEGMALHHDRSVEEQVSDEILKKLHRFPEHLRLMQVYLKNTAYLQGKVIRLIYREDIRDDNGRIFGFGTHMYRHMYGVRLTEMHLDDWTIARLLGHSSLVNVKYYRKMSSQTLADETRQARHQMSLKILECLDGGEEEYEQIRQDAGGQ